MDPPSSPLSKKTIHNSRNLRHFPSTSVVYSHGIHALFLAYTHTRTPHTHTMSTADQPSIGDNGEHNGECQGEGESDLSRKRKDRGEDDPMEAGAAPEAHTDLGIANPPTPAPTEATIRTAQFVSREYFNGNPSGFEDTEVVLARNAVAVFLPESDSRFLTVFTHVVSRVAQMIGRYGDDGYGDRPKEMPRFTYWFQHQDTAKISAIVEHLQERPAKLSIVCIDKPVSSAPKCYTCKEKLVRGEFALQERGYKHSGLNPKMTHNLIELINQPNSKEWQWHLQSSKMYCMKKGCAGCSPKPVVVVVPSGKEEAARKAMHAVWQ
jgi:hypothetical protein